MKFFRRSLDAISGWWRAWSAARRGSGQGSLSPPMNSMPSTSTAVMAEPTWYEVVWADEIDQAHLDWADELLDRQGVTLP